MKDIVSVMEGRDSSRKILVEEDHDDGEVRNV